jgi:hypothetical protein
MPSLASRWTSADFAGAVGTVPFVSALTLGLGNALPLAFKHHLPLELRDTPQHVEPVTTAARFKSGLALTRSWPREAEVDHRR